MYIFSERENRLPHTHGHGEPIMPSPPPGRMYGLLTINIFSALMGTIGNLFTIITVQKTPTLRIISNYWLVSLGNPCDCRNKCFKLMEPALTKIKYTLSISNLYSKYTAKTVHKYT